MENIHTIKTTLKKAIQLAETNRSNLFKLGNTPEVLILSSTDTTNMKNIIKLLDHVEEVEFPEEDLIEEVSRAKSFADLSLENHLQIHFVTKQLLDIKMREEAIKMASEAVKQAQLDFKKKLNKGEE